MDGLDGIAAMGAVAKVAQEYFTGIGHIFFQPVGIVQFLRWQVVKVRKDLVKKIFEVSRAITAFTADVAVPGFGIQFDGCQAGAILTAVTHFLHQQMQSLQTEKGSAVFFFVKGKRFQQPDECNAAFMLNDFAHNWNLSCKVTVNYNVKQQDSGSG